MAKIGEIGGAVRHFVDALYTEIERVGQRDPVVVVAVSKTFGAECVMAAAAAGLVEFGENRVQEAKEKIPKIRSEVRLRWHLIGHLQSNKTRDAITLFDLIHSVDGLEIARALDLRAAQIGKRQDVLIQVNTTAEPQKSGCDPGSVDDLAGAIAVLPNVRVMGLMTIGPLAVDPIPVARAFRSLRQAFDRLAAVDLHGGSMRFCSMGMTDDWRIALAEGSNMLRIGRAIFGER